MSEFFFILGEVFPHEEVLIQVLRDLEAPFGFATVSQVSGDVQRLSGGRVWEGRYYLPEKTDVLNVSTLSPETETVCINLHTDLVPEGNQLNRRGDTFPDSVMGQLITLLASKVYTGDEAYMLGDAALVYFPWQNSNPPNPTLGEVRRLTSEYGYEEGDPESFTIGETCWCVCLAADGWWWILNQDLLEPFLK